MGWFVLATIVGYVAYAAQQRLRTACVVVSVLLAVAFAVWWLVWAPPGTARSLAQWFNNYTFTFTRVLLGLVLGAGAGHAAAQPQPSTAWLSLAGAIVILALVVPYVDGWLSRLTGFKTSIIEIQLAKLSSSTKALQPVQRDHFIRDVALESLTQYDHSIEMDIEFIDRFEIPDLENKKKEGQNVAELEKQEQRLKKQVDQLKVLKKFFGETVSPAARCFKMALDNGLSFESARSHLREMADELTQLVIFERNEKGHPGAEPKRSTRIRQRHEEVLGKVVEATRGIAGFVDTNNTDCGHKRDMEVSSAPLSTEYDLVPHLDVARAFLLLFVNHDPLGREVLRDASKKEFKDFNTPRQLAALMYYSGDSIGQYYDLLAGLKSLARERIETINRVSAACAQSCDELKGWAQKLKARSEDAELIATNNIAYGIASDVSERNPEAEEMLPIADDCIQRLKKSAALKEADPDLKDENSRNLLDTIAYVTIVSEWQKAKTDDLDKTKVRETIAILEKLIAWEERQLDEARKKSKAGSVDYSNLKTLRAHLSSAKELLE
jgi:hypothetical protein